MKKIRSNRGLVLAMLVSLGCTPPALSQQTASDGHEGFTIQQQALVERMLIRELQDRYGIVHDFGTSEEYASLFTADGAISASSGPPLVRGREALIAYADRNRERWSEEPGPDGRISSFMRHVITNAEIEITGRDTAAGMSYVTTIVQRDDIGPAILSVGRYEDQYVKQDGKWLIAHRYIHMDLGDQDLARALGLRND